MNKKIAFIVLAAAILFTMVTIFAVIITSKGKGEEQKEIMNFDNAPVDSSAY